MNAVQLHTWSGAAKARAELVSCPCGQALERTHASAHCPRCGVTLELDEV
jgi:uncharacterized paraquat-inducible protein A